MKMKYVLGASMLVHDSLPVSPDLMNNSLVGGQQPASTKLRLRSHGIKTAKILSHSKQ